MWSSSAATESYEDVSLDSNTGLNHVVRVSKHTQNKMGTCRTAILFLSPKALVFLCGETRRDELRRVASESASSRRRMMPPTPRQLSLSSTDESQWQADLEAQRSIWSARERRVIAAMEMFLDESDDMKVEIKALELLLGPEDREVNLRYILMNASRRGSRIVEISARKRKLTTLWQAETAG